MTIPPLTWADEAPVVEAAVEYAPRHCKPFSPLSIRLGDDLARMWLRTGAMTPHVARHRLEVAA